MAKFKKGDKVKVGSDIATIIREEGDDDPSIPGEMTYLVRFMNRPGSATVAESEIKSANSCARNAKFKINDAVTVWRGKYKGREGRILAIDPNATDKDLAVILGHEGQTVVEVGDLSKHFKDGTNSCRSRNAVVANALNACGTARNDMTSKMFGSVKVYYNPGAPTPLELKFVDDLAEEKTFGEVLEVLKDAKDYRQTYKARIAGLDQAIAWIKQHAK